MIEERVPPQNIEAEQAVLGAMLIDKEAIAKATEVLSADDFYREAHRVIFSAMLELYNKNEAVDMVTVTEILKRDNKLEDIGGIAYITSLANVVLTAANVKYMRILLPKNRFCVSLCAFLPKLRLWAMRPMRMLVRCWILRKAAFWRFPTARKRRILQQLTTY